MDTRQNKSSSMNGIDLNISVEMDDSYGVAQYIPDLNIIVDSLLSPSFNSSNLIDEPSSVNQISFDLNTEPSAEDDIPFDSGPQTTHEDPHINIGMHTIYFFPIFSMFFKYSLYSFTYKKWQFSYLDNHIAQKRLNNILQNCTLCLNSLMDRFTYQKWQI